VMFTAAFRVPVVVGVKVTLMVQLLFGDSDDGQLFVWAKSLRFVPAMRMEIFVRVPLPVFVKVETCGELVIHIIHFSGLKNLDKPTVMVFPKIMVCLDCGLTEFTIPEAELRLLGECGAASTAA
jgi:hypothetical protein